MPIASAQRRQPSRDFFPLVARAIGAKHSQHFVAREEIVLFQSPSTPSMTGAGETRIVADVVRDGSHVRLSYLLPSATARKVVVDDGHTFRQWEPTQRVILEDKSHEQPPKAEQQMLQMLRRNYQCRLEHNTRLNGLDCLLIRIHRRYQGGGDRRLWIDRSHHVILRTEEYDTAGQCRYLSFYETFHSVTHIPPSVFHLAAAGPVRHMPHLMYDLPSAPAAFTRAGLHGCLPAWVPQGYAMIGCALATYHDGGHAAVLRFGDGMQTFCVFEEKRGMPRDTFLPPQSPYQRLAQTGQQVWEALEPGLRIFVIGDAILPGSLGTEMLRALDPRSEALLQARLAGVFGSRFLTTAKHLRTQGWGYNQIVSLALYLQTRPEKTAAATLGWKRAQDWQQIMSGLHAPSEILDRKARRWIAATLATHGKTG